MATDAAETGRTGEVSDRSPRARTWYQDEYAATGYELALLGQTLAEMGETFGVDERTINRWMTKPKFRRAVNAGRAAADGKMAVALYKRGLGYSHPAVKIFPPKSEGGEPVTVDYIQHYPPDTAAASLWLRNRQPSKWREKTEMAVTGQLTLEHLILTAATERQAEQPAIEGEIIKPDDEG